ncbi:unnamed protein product [Dicrocoelium dendriticum]|nr:unnamed protein product [Dicrocoelium dendriticum]
MGDGNSRGILSISEDTFKEYDDILQGSFSYALKIWTESDANQTARNLFPHLTQNVSVEPQVFCEPRPQQNHTYSCVILLYNIEEVTWDYPENWVGPARYLRNIFYDESKITVQFVGMHWPPKHSIDSGQFRESALFCLLRAFIFYSKSHENFSGASNKPQLPLQALKTKPFLFVGYDGFS